MCPVSLLQFHFLPLVGILDSACKNLNLGAACRVIRVFIIYFYLINAVNDHPATRDLQEQNE